MPTPTKRTCVPLEWVLLPVLVMVALFPILWLTFTRENSKFVPYINMDNLLILDLFADKKILTTPFVKQFPTTLMAYREPLSHMMWLASGTRISCPGWGNLLPCFCQMVWKWCQLLENFISVPTGQHASPGLVSCFSKGQAILMERYWKPFGLLLIKSLLRQGQWLWPIVKSSTMIIWETQTGRN